ncbi:MAG TPA: DUF4198 domain-containing protein [Chitinophagaceae bacterium]
MNKRIFFFTLVFAIINVSAVELWIQPDKFIYKRTEPITIKFLKGLLFIGQDSSLSREKISCMELYYEDVVDKNLATSISDEDSTSLQLAMIDEGTVMMTLDTKDKFFSHEAAAFNRYLKANGFDEALEDRIQNGDTMKDAREKLEYCAKTIFQVGETYTDAYGKRTDLPIDIVPLYNPYKLSDVESHKVVIFFMGQRLKNTTIRVLHKTGEEIHEIDYVTDEKGEADFVVTPDGEWMVSCAKMIKLRDNPDADWQIFEGTLTWGYF